MHITTLYQSRSANLTTDLAKVLSHIPLEGDMLNITVASTNVPHSDDTEMLSRLQARRNAYRDAAETLGHEYRINHADASHQLVETIANKTGDVLIIDSLNLHVSNFWLSHNSPPASLITPPLHDEMSRISKALYQLAHDQSFAHVIVLTNEVCADLDIRSIHLETYAHMISLANTILSAHMPHIPATHSEFIAGTILVPVSTIPTLPA